MLFEQNSKKSSRCTSQRPKRRPNSFKGKSTILLLGTIALEGEKRRQRQAEREPSGVNRCGSPSTLRRRHSLRLSHQPCQTPPVTILIISTLIWTRIRAQVVEKLESSPILALEKNVAPQASGIYALYFKETLVYIGKASKGMTKSKRTLRARLNEHVGKISGRQKYRARRYEMPLPDV